jgi:hypothetical protein
LGRRRAVSLFGTLNLFYFLVLNGTGIFGSGKKVEIKTCGMVASILKGWFLWISNA